MSPRAALIPADLSEAIPPAYAEYVGTALLAHLSAAAAA